MYIDSNNMDSFYMRLRNYYIVEVFTWTQLWGALGLLISQDSVYCGIVLICIRWRRQTYCVTKYTAWDYTIVSDARWFHGKCFWSSMIKSSSEHFTCSICFKKSRAEYKFGIIYIIPHHWSIAYDFNPLAWKPTFYNLAWYLSGL